MHPLLRWLFQVASGVGGYLGIFVVSILGNLIPFIPIPYLLVVYLYAAFIPGSNPLSVGLVSGLGAGVGKLLVYLFSRGASSVVLSNETRERYARVSKMIGNWGMFAVFLFAATPSPDDVIIIPLGFMGYDPLKFFLGVTAGKVAISIAAAYTGRVVSKLSHGEFWTATIVSVVLFMIVMVLLLVLDWEKILEVVSERGLRGLIEELRRGGSGFLVKKKQKKIN